MSALHACKKMLRFIQHKNKETPNWNKALLNVDIYKHKWLPSESLCHWEARCTETRRLKRTQTWLTRSSTRGVGVRDGRVQRGVSGGHAGDSCPGRGTWELGRAGPLPPVAGRHYGVRGAGVQSACGWARKKTKGQTHKSQSRISVHRLGIT